MLAERTYLVIDGRATLPQGPKEFVALVALDLGDMGPALGFPVNADIDAVRDHRLQTLLGAAAPHVGVTRCFYRVE